MDIRVLRAGLAVLGVAVAVTACNQQLSSPTAPGNTLAGGARTNWETGDGGCTPGFWKQPQRFDSWPSDDLDGLPNVALTPSLGFNAAFELGANSHWFPDSFTMLDALNAQGGGLNAFARHAAAALLNATLEFYPLSWEQVRALIYQTHFTWDDAAAIEAAKDIFEGLNEGRCPLD